MRNILGMYYTQWVEKSWPQKSSMSPPGVELLVTVSHVSQDGTIWTVSGTRMSLTIKAYFSVCWLLFVWLPIIVYF